MVVVGRNLCVVLEKEKGFDFVFLAGNRLVVDVHVGTGEQFQILVPYYCAISLLCGTGIAIG